VIFRPGVLFLKVKITYREALVFLPAGAVVHKFVEYRTSWNQGSISSALGVNLQNSLCDLAAHKILRALGVHAQESSVFETEHNQAL